MIPWPMWLLIGIGVLTFVAALAFLTEWIREEIKEWRNGR
jgi:hypothetical protein